MRIHHDTAQNYIRTLAASIGKDPASLENWRCLHLGHAEHSPVEWDAGALKKLKETHKETDCDVVQCSDNDILLISREAQAGQLQNIAAELMALASVTENEQNTMALYDLFRDWRLIRELLLSKTDLPDLPTSAPEGHDFGEISALQEVFYEAKKRRQSRQPLHVMVVEDDPVTRRIVTGSFKEHYALITAADGQEAVANYLLYAPDIVFLDIGLPDASGFDVLRQIMATDPDAYVVMFSSNSYLDNITAALGAGASGFIAKPFKREKMRHYIQDSAMHHCKSAS